MNTINYRLLTLITIISTLFISCSSDDDAPIPVNEEEVITTVTVTLTPVGGGAAVTLQSRDLDGDGPDAPEVTVSGNLVSSASYTGTVVLLNETETPAENITNEVQEEAEEHQFFYVVNGANISTTYTSFDANNNPLGTTFNLSTGAASTGTFTVTLVHEPTKPNTGLANAGGETDVEVTFNVTVQ